MASRSEENLCCPVCQDIYRNAVVLKCSHSFCKDCLERWWTDRPTMDCPVCKESSLLDEPRFSLALNRLCESYLEKRLQKAAESVCTQHFEKLQLFCLQHREPICLVCRDSKNHGHHNFSPINEAVGDLKEELKTSMQVLRDKVQICNEAHRELSLAMEHTETQTRQTEKHIKEQFLQFHRLLDEEEKTRISALREEEELKSRRIKDKIKVLIKEMAALSKTITAAEEQLKAPDIPFLLEYKKTVEAVQCRPLLEETPQLGPGALIDQAKHLGNLAFKIWIKIGKVRFTPVILDPNTAARRLSLSTDLTSVRRREGEGKTLPRNPERSATCVLGYGGFMSGAHTWSVQVSQTKDWALGIGTKSSNGGLSEEWGMRFFGGEYFARTVPGESTLLSVDKKLLQITVNLDLDHKKLSFSDAETNTVIHAFSITFSGNKLFPYVSTNGFFPLKILPRNLSVAAQ